MGLADVGAWTLAVLGDALGSLGRTVALLAAVIIPLMIAIEWLKERNVLTRWADWAEPAARRLGLSGRATFPLLSGIVFGLAYGAGVILESAREGGLSRKDCTLLAVFLVACHAVIEDTLLFVPFGVNPAALLGTRFLTALCLTFLVARLYGRRRHGGTGGA